MKEIHYNFFLLFKNVKKYSPSPLLDNSGSTNAGESAIFTAINIHWHKAVHQKTRQILNRWFWYHPSTLHCFLTTHHVPLILPSKTAVLSPKNSHNKLLPGNACLKYFWCLSYASIVLTALCVCVCSKWNSTSDFLFDLELSSFFPHQNYLLETGSYKSNIIYCKNSLFVY